jgi:hypothetical protein
MADMHRDAVISDCGKFRYLLRRSWDIARPTVAFVMLNPSTADASQDDPTIRKCVGFAERLGFGAITVTNLFAYRATKPADLKAAGYPIGDECNFWINLAAREAQTVICAWDVNARGLSRPHGVRSVLRGAGRPAKALKLTPDGIPCHPLMLPYSCTLVDLPENRHDA